MFFDNSFERIFRVQTNHFIYRLTVKRELPSSLYTAIEAEQVSGRVTTSQVLAEGNMSLSLTTLQTTLPPLVNAFMEKHPNAELKLLTGKTHEIVSFVRDKKADVGIVASTREQWICHPY